VHSSVEIPLVNRFMSPFGGRTIEMIFLITDIWSNMPNLHILIK
jgi:hypothetical protein